MRISEGRTNSSLRKRVTFCTEITPELPAQKSMACFEGPPEQLINNLKPLLLSPPIEAIEWFTELLCFGLSLIQTDVETLRKDRKDQEFISFTPTSKSYTVDHWKSKTTCRSYFNYLQPKFSWIFISLPTMFSLLDLWIQESTSSASTTHRKYFWVKRKICWSRFK